MELIRVAQGRGVVGLSGMEIRRSASRLWGSGLRSVAPWSWRRARRDSLGLRAASRLIVGVGGLRYPAVLISEIRDEGAAYDTLLLTDIAQAQEWLGRVGKLSRIDVRVPGGPAGEAMLAQLRQRLPPDVQLHDARGRTRESLDMTSAFTTNLKAMSLLALLVSTLLIYGAISFAVVQRRRVIGILRALGATRSEVLAIVLTEAAALGVVGAAIGLGLGLVIGHELITLVSRTINDLYFVVAVRETTLPVSSVVKARSWGIFYGSGCRFAACARSGWKRSTARTAAIRAGGACGSYCAQAHHRQCGAGGFRGHRGVGFGAELVCGVRGTVPAVVECRGDYPRCAAGSGARRGQICGAGESDRAAGVWRYRRIVESDGCCRRGARHGRGGHDRCVHHGREFSRVPARLARQYHAGRYLCHGSGSGCRSA